MGARPGRVRKNLVSELVELSGECGTGRQWPARLPNPCRAAVVAGCGDNFPTAVMPHPDVRVPVNEGSSVQDPDPRRHQVETRSYSARRQPPPSGRRARGSGPAAWRAHPGRVTRRPLYLAHRPIMGPDAGNTTWRAARCLRRPPLAAARSAVQEECSDQSALSGALPITSETGRMATRRSLRGGRRCDATALVAP